MNPAAKMINDILVKNNGVKNIPKSIRLGNLPRDKTNIENELRNVFEHIGPVRDIYVPKKESVPIGYGFVEFLDSADAIHAVAYFCRGLILDENKVRVELAEGQRRRPVEMAFRDMSPADRVFIRAKYLVDNMCE
jgi:RNA recognition motif-containing protein